MPDVVGNAVDGGGKDDFCIGHHLHDDEWESFIGGGQDEDVGMKIELMHFLFVVDIPIESAEWIEGGVDDLVDIADEGYVGG